VALEMNIFIDTSDGESYIAFYPQSHWRFLSIFQIQMGIGLIFSKTKFTPQLIHRAIVAKPEGLF
jgi:hypothetical protein